MPALPLILFAIVAKLSLEEVFLAGLIPAILMIGICSWWGIQAQSEQLEAKPFSRHEAMAALAAARWELALPIVPIGGMFSGLATPVESAALTAFYAFFVATFVHRDLKLLADVPRVMAQCGLLVGGILLILGVALGLTNYLVDARLPDQIISFVTDSIESKWAFLLALNIFLLVVGCIMDIFSAIVVLTPLIVPTGLAFGVHPLHLGIVFLANLELGYLTPPVGMNLFFSSYRFDRPIFTVYGAVLPLFLLLCAGVILITYLPFLSTALPGLLR
jgi:tripartite ATP-independent transporter DctM subunit